MESTLQRSFGTGELAPAYHARADQAAYATGLRTCRNFLVRKEGGVSNRAGLRFVGATKSSTAGTRLFRYVSETAGSSVLIEAGSGYFRFFRNGAAVTVAGVPAYAGATPYVPGDLVLSGGVNYYCVSATTGNAPPNATFWYALTGNIYEIPTAYPVTDRFKWTQDGRVITITHPSHPPRELTYSSLTRWVLSPIVFGAGITAPVGGAGVPGAAGALTYRYVVTSAKAETYEESIPSGTIVVAATAVPTQAAPIALSWTAVVGAAEYYVYGDPYGNGAFGFIGASSTNAFNDTGITPDFTLTPPIPRVLFGTPNNYPATATSHQQRRLFAFTNVDPEAVYGSRIGFPSNFGIASPLQDDDAVTFRIAGNNHNPVRWLLSLKTGLVVLTDGGEWTVTGSGGPGNIIAPNSIAPEQETYVGAADVRPVIIGNTIVYLQARGAILHDLAFNQQVWGLGGRDLTIFATHLFKKKTIVAIDYQQVPDSIIWCVRSDGVLLGLTYIPEQDQWGWHRHDTAQNATAGLFEDICVVPETSVDVPYVLVARTIGGVVVRYIEKLESREITTFDTDAFFVDGGLSYSGAPATVFSGLGHLNGQVVAVVADGSVLYNGDPAGASAASFIVSGGSLTLASAHTNVHIGLRYVSDLETLDLDANVAIPIRDKKKRVGAVGLLVEASARSFSAGPDATHLRTYTQQAWAAAADEFTGLLTLNMTSSFGDAGRVLVRQTDPLPLTVLGLLPSLELGGA